MNRHGGRTATEVKEPKRQSNQFASKAPRIPEYGPDVDLGLVETLKTVDYDTYNDKTLSQTIAESPRGYSNMRTSGRF
jgi:hypothetical protein